MNQSYTKAERHHVNNVKCLPCSVCDQAAPSVAHHIKQTNHYSCVALCVVCHKCDHNGIHGRQAIWRVMKMDEYDALYVTFKRLSSNKGI